MLGGGPGQSGRGRRRRGAMSKGRCFHPSEQRTGAWVRAGGDPLCSPRGFFLSLSLNSRKSAVLRVALSCSQKRGFPFLMFMRKKVP